MSKLVYDVEFLIESAKYHGENSESDHEVGDLQMYLRVANDIMTPGQRATLICHSEVKATLEAALCGLPINYPK